MLDTIKIEGRTNMGDNLKIITLENELVATLNKSTLPITVKKMVLDRVLATATESMNQVLKAEAEAYEKEKESEANGIQ